MKRIYLTFFVALFSTLAFAQAIHIFHDGETEPKVFANGAIQRISFQPKFLGSTEYQHVYETLDGEFRFDKVDSVKFNLPHLVTYKKEFVLPYDVSGFYVGYSSSYPSVEIPYLDVRPEKPNWCYINDWYAEYPHTAEYELCAGDIKVPFKVTITNKPALDYFYVKYKNKELSKTDSIRFSTGFYDSRVLSPEVESLVFPRVADNLEITDFKYATISNPELVIAGIQWHVNGDYDRQSSTVGPMLNTRYDDEGNFVIDIPEFDGVSKHFEFAVSNDEITTRKDYHIQQTPLSVHSEAEHIHALRELYDMTDGPNWTDQENWWGDKPFYRWQGLRHGSEPIVTNTVYHMSLNSRDHRGTIPESFTVFLDDCVEINLSGCALYGTIPYNVRHHKNWQKFGWNIIPQSLWYGGGFDYDDINLHVDNVDVEDFVNNTTTTTYDVLKQNKLTWVFNAGAVDMIDGISDKRVNLYLDYKNKGFGVVAQVGGYWDTPYDNYRYWVLDHQQRHNLPKDILWVKEFDKATIGPYGSMSVLDSAGNLLWYKDFDYGIDEAYYTAQVDSVCRKYLGDPEEHDPYVSKPYESQDYSMDGEVVTLQKATVGKGIDLVFMGDQYVDTMMVAGGMYERDMKASMEYFFDVEPYKSLRDRFNVYYVKVVSKNGYDGTDHRLDYNNDLVFEYARKIPGVDIDNVTISVISGNPNFSFFVSGGTVMFDSGASIAYMEAGGPSTIICHEAGGHGFAKLLDEYIYNGYEDNHTQSGAEESFKEWIKTSYHDRGWGMNVAATDDPELVPWTHFLKDERYKDEVGIYKGAWLWPEELWRASENSIMKESNYLWFNAPSREAIYKRVMQLSEGDSWTYDYETFVAFDQEVMNKAREAARQMKSIPKETRKFIERAPQIVNDKFMSVSKAKRSATAPIQQIPNLNIPKDKTLIPVDQYKGDIQKAHKICVQGTSYVIE